MLKVNPKIMTKMTTAIRAALLCIGALAAIVGSAYIGYKADQKLFELHARKNAVITVGTDLARKCLVQCDGKAVERFYVREGKLACECSAPKNTQKK